jgi:hypothetical protein
MIAVGGPCLSDDQEKRLDERLGGIERDLERLKGGLGLLGVKPCSWCGAFYRRSEPGSLLDCGDLVCFDCIPQWWSQKSPQLSVHDREKDELLLRRWLVSHHHAEVIQRPEDLPEPERLRMKLISGCEQCDGSGKTYAGKPCSHCEGRGTVWVVVRAPDSESNVP